MQFDPEKRFKAIHSFLRQHAPFWQEEVLSRYPNELKDFPEPWLEELADFDNEQLYEIEREAAFEKFHSRSLRDYFLSIAELEKLPRKLLPTAQPLPHRSALGISGKKQYEIQTLLPFVQQLRASEGFTEIVDYAGGVGYLAQVLCEHALLPTLSIDFNPELQASGRKRLAKYQNKLSATLEYQTLDLLSGKNLPLKKNALHIGLHCCGSLTTQLLRHACVQQQGSILSFGCCYYHTKPSDLSLSSLSKSSPLQITPPALTLASRSHQDKKDAFLLSKQVKLYRYLIHLYCYHELGLKEFKNLGNSPRRLYRSEFSFYGLEQLRRLNIEADDSRAEALKEFSSDNEMQRRVRLMIAANILRGRLGRLIEIYLTLDRALFLKEGGGEVEVARYFSAQISPRNIGLLGTWPRH